MSGTTKKLRVAHVSIKNILGLTELEFAPKGFTEIEGGNGTGKTSTIEAIRAVLRGGHDATLLRKGAERGEIVIVLDDGTSIKKTVTPDDTDVKIMRDERVLKRPAEAIRALHDALSVNPVEFLRAPEKSRVDALLQVMPISPDIMRVQEIAGDLLGEGAGLDLIEDTKRRVFDERTGVNRTARDKDGAIKQLRATLPENVPDAPDTDASLLEQINAIDAERDSKVEGIGQEFSACLQVIDDTITGLHDRIREIEEEARRKVAEVNEEVADAKRRKAEALSRCDAAKAEVRAKHSESRAVIETKLAGIKAAHEAQARYSLTTENIARMSAEFDRLKEDAEALTAALESLEAYKAELLANLPIPGLEVVGGKLFRNGIPFDRLNSAQQVEIAVAVAKLRAGELGVICVDGLELLDPEHFESFVEEAGKSGLQLIVSRVSEGPLRVVNGDV